MDERPVGFKLAKSKEILAYLVDRQGSGVTRSELFAAVWEDRAYDRRQQKQLDVYIRSLRETLREYGAAEMLVMEKGILRVRPDTFLCDAYRFYAGDSDAVNAYLHFPKALMYSIHYAYRLKSASTGSLRRTWPAPP